MSASIVFGTVFGIIMLLIGVMAPIFWELDDEKPDFHSKIISSLVFIFTSSFFIVYCAVDSGRDLVWTDGFVGAAASVTLWALTIASAVIVVVSFIKPDEDGLPPGFKVLGLFFRHPGEQDMRQALANQQNEGERKRAWLQMGRALRDVPADMFGRYGAKLQEWQMRKMKARIEAEADKVRAASETMHGAEGYEVHKRAEKILREQRTKKREEH